jgi:hypothetical protein
MEKTLSPSRPPEGDGASTRLRPPPPSLHPLTPSPPPAEVVGRSPGERVGALLVPGGGAPRKTSVRRGREVVVPWRLAVARGAGQRAALVAFDGCLAPFWQPGLQMGSGGPRWALAGWGAALRGAFCRG